MGLNYVPNPQTHLQNALESATTTAAVVITGSAAAATAWMTQLDVISKVLAIVATLLNIVWIVAQMVAKARRNR
jgi:hypothetical protein